MIRLITKTVNIAVSDGVGVSDEYITGFILKIELNPLEVVLSSFNVLVETEETGTLLWTRTGTSFAEQQVISPRAPRHLFDGTEIAGAYSMIAVVSERIRFQITGSGSWDGRFDVTYFDVDQAPVAPV